jgi:hypothetical protein
MVDLAEGESVRDDWLASLGIGDDMSGIEQLDMTQPADRALLVVRMKTRARKSG